MGAKKLAYQISTALVVLLFTFAGVMKVTPLVSSEIHNEMRSKFNSYARVPPFDFIRLDPGLYMLLVGLTELVCVVLIVFAFIGRAAEFATWVLLGIMLGALYTHLMVGDTPKDMGGAFFGLAIVLTRLYTMGALWQAEIKIKV